MLTAEENEMLTKVGPGTPMGNLMREHWLPAFMSSELDGPDGPPLRVRLLGENLIAFRATSGKVGLLAHNCPHRGASLFFGRNEEEGIRCVYHGWKFDIEGPLSRYACRTARKRLQGQGAGHGLSHARAERRRLGLHGAALRASSSTRP